MKTEKIIYSIGHSNLTMGQFIELLHIYQIKSIADVRRFPSSKQYPHFKRLTFQHDLEQKSIKYFWLGELLGGYRKGGYQIYMESESFLAGIDKLLQITKTQTTAILCAEKLFLRCHRRFISNHLFQLG